MVSALLEESEQENCQMVQEDKADMEQELMAAFPLLSVHFPPHFSGLFLSFNLGVRTLHLLDSRYI